MKINHNLSTNSFQQFKVGFKVRRLWGEALRRRGREGGVGHAKLRVFDRVWKEEFLSTQEISWFIFFLVHSQHESGSGNN